MKVYSVQCALLLKLSYKTVHYKCPLVVTVSHLAAVLSKIYSSAEHSSNVCVTLIKPFLDDGLQAFSDKLLVVRSYKTVTCMNGDPWNNILSLL